MYQKLCKFRMEQEEKEHMTKHHNRIKDLNTNNTNNSSEAKSTFNEKK